MFHDKNERFRIPEGFSWVPFYGEFAYCITNLLRNIPEASRFEIIRNCFELGQSLVTMATVITSLGHEYGEYGYEEATFYPTIKRERLGQLEHIFVKKVNHSSKEKTLISLPGIRRILFVWEKINSDNARKWVKRICKDLPSAIALFVEFLAIRTVYFEQGSKHNFVFDLTDLERYLEPRIIFETTTKIADKMRKGEMLLNQYEQESVRLILEGYRTIYSTNNA